MQFHTCFALIRRFCVLLLAVGFVLGAGVATPAGAETQTVVQVAQAPGDTANDPLESVNRVIFELNEILQTILFRPLAELYKFILPDAVEEGIHNILLNLRTPVILANDLLQFEGKRALVTVQRFAINTTIGVAGFMDVASTMGIPGHSEDFGQTLGAWGVGEGFYLVLPLFGPSNPRDAIGKVADIFLDPLGQWASNTDRDEISYARTGVSGIDTYSRVMDDLEKLKETSIDYYAAVRSITRQRREAEIRNGTAEGAPLPNIRYDFNAELTSTSN
jgi:phospholipid-binding lipoprotein MlaA